MHAKATLELHLTRTDEAEVPVEWYQMYLPELQSVIATTLREHGLELWIMVVRDVVPIK